MQVAILLRNALANARSALRMSTGAGGVGCANLNIFLVEHCMTGRGFSRDGFQEDPDGVAPKGTRGNDAGNGNTESPREPQPHHLQEFQGY